MRALELVNRTVREIDDEPFIVDASRAETELGLLATPLADAVEQTVRWYQEHATPSSAADQKSTAAAAPATAAPTS
jgi:dTDP-D-glucose 4,6-dehydratase